MRILRPATMSRPNSSHIQILKLSFQLSKLNKNFKTEWTSEKIKEFLLKNKIYKESIYTNSTIHAEMLKGWRIRALDESTQE